MRLTTIAAAAAVLTAGAASAQISTPYITVNVSNANGSGSFVVDLAGPGVIPQPDGGVVFVSSVLGPMFPMDISDSGGNVIATLNSLISPSTADDITTPDITDARSGLTFSIQAGGLDTEIEVVSSFIETPSTLGPNPVLRANSGYTASDTSDLNGDGIVDGDGVTVSSAGALTEFYVNGGVDFGILFDGLNSSFSAGPFGSEAVDATTGDVVLGANVSSFQFRSAFTLSAGDTATGNFGFFAVPAPASSGLIALGGLVAARRRR
ncbi:MAG: hypothetical protein AAFR96_09420 [Planctomycetota bacterium]